LRELWTKCKIKNEMERRKIVYQDGAYQILKPKENGNFFPWGEQKSLKAIADIFREKRFELIIPPYIKEEIDRYLKREETRKQEYRINNGLESKTI